MKVLALLLLHFAFPNVANADGSTQWFFDDKFFRLDPITLPPQFTIETWVKATDDSVDGNNRWMNFQLASEQSSCFRQKERKLTVGTWVHFVMTWDGFDQIVYLDGVTMESGGGRPVTKKCTESPGSLVIGGEWGPESTSAKIWLDTVAIYDQAWSTSDVENYGQDKKCVDVNDIDLWGVWYTNDGADQSGNNGKTAEVVTSTDTTAVGEYGYCSGTCFHADGTVLLESGVSKRFSELGLGDVVKTSDGEGTFSFNPVLTLPHAKNTQTATFLNLTTETGKSVIMTPDHYIPDCAGEELTANKLVVGDCLNTIDGKETLFEITSVKKSGIYTATTKDKYIVVDGIVASPHSKFSRMEQVEEMISWSSGKPLLYFKKSLRGSHA